MGINSLGSGYERPPGVKHSMAKELGGEVRNSLMGIFEGTLNPLDIFTDNNEALNRSDGYY